jgi:hypothetical protein
MGTRISRLLRYDHLARVVLVEWVLVAALLTLGAVTGLFAVHEAVAAAHGGHATDRPR